MNLPSSKCSTLSMLTGRARRLATCDMPKHNLLDNATHTARGARPVFTNCQFLGTCTQRQVKSDEETS